MDGVDLRSEKFVLNRDLNVNRGKCKIMSHTWKRNLSYEYTMQDQKIDSIDDTIDNLGVRFDIHGTFNDHIQWKSPNKELSMIGLLF